MIVTTQALFRLAYGKYAVGAYNINNMEQALGLFQGHIQSQAPFIIQISKGARKYAGIPMIEAIVRAAEQLCPEAIFAVHLDHGDEETCYACIDSGFYSSVMIDASHEPFDQNVAITRRVVERAHAKGLSVEAELGMLGGVEEDIALDEKHAMLTDPDEARNSSSNGAGVTASPSRWEPVTGVQIQGSSRSALTDRSDQQQLPGFPLVMHGSSSVPQDEVARINAAGGGLDPSARGADENEFRRAATLGVTKVNIDTDGRLVWTRVHREYFRDHPEEFDFRKPGTVFVDEFAKFIVHKAQKLGSAGQLSAVRDALAK
jgi:fructose-bisphosphate aldolase class II